MEPRHLTVEIAAGCLDVLEWGTDGPARDTVLALHGFPESAWEWASVAGLVTGRGIRVVAPMQRGYSAGARPTAVDAYAIEQLGADALAVVDHLGLARVHVLGHDWGASVAWWLAAHHPDRVQTLCAVSIPHLSAFTEALDTDPEQRARSGYFGLFRQQHKAEDVLLEGGALRLQAMFGGEVSDEQMRRHLAVVGDRAGLTAALNWYRAMRRHDLPVVTVPTTYIWGERDLAVARSGAEATASWVTGEYRFVPVPDGGHWLPERHPELVAAEVLARLG